MSTTAGEAMSRCPACGARVYVNAGSPTPPHQPDGATQGAAQCPGSGQPSR
ncbi:hypothetical protein ACFFX1_01890 [Dactylosporangium sucinum]|uniref:Uncharacterized protein n=1 Tax=Dactylosporangium sucinum TaxID=1424081 RepID=A0A917WJH1_9ACTN|nr:hypothetical protein [Dactylosporangium sucinum]GGM08559.1 hypothetical protein GCM10007977_007020 [Dactylosporangium sucinum]